MTKTAKDMRSAATRDVDVCVCDRIELNLESAHILAGLLLGSHVVTDALMTINAEGGGSAASGDVEMFVHYRTECTVEGVSGSTGAKGHHSHVFTSATMTATAEDTRSAAAMGVDVCVCQSMVIEDRGLVVLQ